MAIPRGVGALMRLGARMAWSCGRIFEEDWTTSHPLSDMLLTMVLKFVFGIICGMRDYF